MFQAARAESNYLDATPVPARAGFEVEHSLNSKGFALEQGR